MSPVCEMGLKTERTRGNNMIKTWQPFPTLASCEVGSVCHQDLPRPSASLEAQLCTAGCDRYAEKTPSGDLRPARSLFLHRLRPTFTHPPMLSLCGHHRASPGCRLEQAKDNSRQKSGDTGQVQDCEKWGWLRSWPWILVPKPCPSHPQ